MRTVRIALCAAFATFTAISSAEELLDLKAVGVPAGNVNGVAGEALLKKTARFKELHPEVNLLPATGLTIAGNKNMDVQPLMQIAGEVSPDVIYVNFRQSDTYIQNKFLYPLDDYIETAAGVAPSTNSEDRSILSNDDYFALIESGTHFEDQISWRMPRLIWDVIRRECPYREQCAFRQEHGYKPTELHFHTWAVPQNQYLAVLFFRKDVFAEVGLPERAPETLDEMLEWARKVTDPERRIYGLNINTAMLGYNTLNILYTYGGRAVDKNEEGKWACVFNTKEAVDAYTFVARIMAEPFTNEHGTFKTPLDYEDASGSSKKYGMWFGCIDQNTFNQLDPNIVSFGPVPRGPSGSRGSEYNAGMLGLYAGNVEKNKRLRDMAWEYAWFMGGREANAINARVYVENGLSQYVQPQWLIEAGYPDEVEKVPSGWDDTLKAALTDGVPEAYGRNCQMVYQYMSQALDQMRIDKTVRKTIAEGDIDAARERIQQIMDERVRTSNERMIGIVPPDVQRMRNRVSMIVIIAIATIFFFVFRMVFRVFDKVAPRTADGKLAPMEIGKHKLAYALLLPSLLTCLLWSYYPLIKGTLMAFQNYNVRGFSEWIGMKNFSTVLFDKEFWYSILVSLKYTAISLAFGFTLPIGLAFLLAEVPKGKTLFRSIYYLPAVLSGVVVLFMWKGFYGSNGMINQFLNFFVTHINATFGTTIEMFTESWLDSPTWALFFCLLPGFWAGMGPGCLIYLAALKTIPDDLYEAADMEGAGFLQKIRYIALPSIKSLVIINFIGAFCGAMHAGATNIMAMTGGGPYTPYGATEVVGLHIYWESFGYLRFGTATAMAWVVASLLIGFTVQQLQRLSKMDFKAAGGPK